MQEKIHKLSPRLYDIAGEVFKYLVYLLVIPVVIALAVTILSFLIGGVVGVWFGWKWVIIEPVINYFN